MPRRLIINADDLGQSAAITDGICHAAADGIVTSATLLCNGPDAERALSLAAGIPRLGVGVHLNLTQGMPIAQAGQVPALIGPDGRFRHSPGGLLFRSAVSSEFRRQVRIEWDAQVRWFLDHGRQPTHLDSHKHVHAAPALFAIACELAEQHGIGVIRLPFESPIKPIWARPCPSLKRRRRIVQTVSGRLLTLLFARRDRRQPKSHNLRAADRFYGIADTGGCNQAVIEALLRMLPEGTSELMVHPGLPDPAAASPGRLAKSRPVELAALLNPEVKQLVEREGIALVHY